MAHTTELPGTADKETLDLIEAAQAYFDVHEHIKRLAKERDERKSGILTCMKGMKRRSYTNAERGLAITVKPISETVKVTKVRPPEPGKKRGRPKKATP